MPLSLAATAMTIYRAMVGTVIRHTRNGTLLWLITIPDPAVVTSNPKYLENQDGKRLCPREEHEKTPRRKHRPRRKITDVEQIGAGLKRNDVEGLHMETDATVDSSITSSSRVNKRLTTPCHYSSVHFNSPELPCAGIVERDPFNQNSNRYDQEKWSTSEGGPVFSNLFRLDRTDPLNFGPKFPEILVEWIAPLLSSTLGRRFLEFLIADFDFASAFGLPGRLVRCSNSHMLANFLKALDDVGVVFNCLMEKCLLLKEKRSTPIFSNDCEGVSTRMRVPG